MARELLFFEHPNSLNLRELRAEEDPKQTGRFVPLAQHPELLPAALEATLGKGSGAKLVEAVGKQYDPADQQGTFAKRFLAETAYARGIQPQFGQEISVDNYEQKHTVLREHYLAKVTEYHVGLYANEGASSTLEAAKASYDANLQAGLAAYQKFTGVEPPSLDALRNDKPSADAIAHMGWLLSQKTMGVVSDDSLLKSMADPTAGSSAFTSLDDNYERIASRVLFIPPSEQIADQSYLLYIDKQALPPTIEVQPPAPAPDPKSSANIPDGAKTPAAGDVHQAVLGMKAALTARADTRTGEPVKSAELTPQLKPGGLALG